MRERIENSLIRSEEVTAVLPTNFDISINSLSPRYPVRVAIQTTEGRKVSLTFQVTPETANKIGQAFISAAEEGLEVWRPSSSQDPPCPTS